jgi:dTDP-4-amino-4,6-dideoxygalactose transaminase
LLACFSFHPRKIITTGDGGMITTADEAMAARLRQLRQHAMSVASTIRHDSQRVVFESFAEPAYNFRMTDMQAAMGRTQLRRLPQTIVTRRALAERYRAALDVHPILAPPREQPWMRANFQSYPLRIRPGTRLSQVEIMQHLLDRGVSSRRGVGNAHTEPAYASTPWSCGPAPCDAAIHRRGHCLRLRHSEEARDQTIMIPLFHGMTEAEQDHVIAALKALPA